MLWESMAFRYLSKLWDGNNGYEKLNRAISMFCQNFGKIRVGCRICKDPEDIKSWLVLVATHHHGDASVNLQNNI